MLKLKNTVCFLDMTDCLLADKQGVPKIYAH